MKNMPEVEGFDKGASQIGLTAHSASYLGIAPPGAPPLPAGLVTPPPEKAKVPRVATFFSLYPEPLGLKDETTFCISLGVPLKGFGKTAMHLKEDDQPFWLHRYLSDSIAISIRFHRGRRKQHVLEEYDERLMSIVRHIGGDPFPDFGRQESSAYSGDHEGGAPQESSGMSYTVVEMSTQLVMPAADHWTACEPGEAIMGPTLTRCINGLVQVIDAYRFGDKVGLASPAREQLGPGIVSATRPADPSQGSLDSPARYVINAFASYGGNGFVVGTHTDDTYKNMLTYLLLQSSGHPAIVLGRIQAELQQAMFRGGNFPAVVIFAHSASEVMMDAALMAIQFEIRMTPGDASPTFMKPLKTRILSEYCHRLGGTWSTETTNPVGTWIRDVLLIRHRVAHGGYSPFYEEAQAAHDAHFALGKFLRDRLAAQAKHYPFTSGILVTANGFERRGIRSKAADEAVRVASERLNEFARWRDDLIALRG